MDTLRERAKTPAKPFFLYFALTAPHTPWLPLPGFQGKSQAGDYGDFEMWVDWKISKDGDSGIYLSVGRADNKPRVS